MKKAGAQGKMFDIDKIVTALRTDPNMQRTAGAGAAGLAAGMLLGGGGLGKLAKYGALAAVGGLAYSAWQKSQQNKTPQGDTPPTDERFIPQAPSEREALGRTLVRAMIAAAKADGRVDADEKERIFGRLEAMDLSAEEKAFVFDELATPLDLDAVVRGADTPEHAAEIYAASLVAITADTASERAYLETLANRLKLPAALVTEIHAAADAEKAAP
ncbi:tellurite resistance TerB family protein [Pelagibacterium xiamenense]|uniref:tellurite resistance TerB family protein n=1 Tax=Pelagibacterium xiamenense TaxID=2901140 RepID=UPI001E4E871A|nr:tellurite resistance TerB family protein [Pelagibacterium xiamenense]MCD7060219.1 tellurite resistance TerB family protein [Pelagibacterium xiamenense]